MTNIALKHPLLRPPMPAPRKTPLGTLGLIATLRRNPLEVWTEAHFERPVMVGRSFLGERAVVSDPVAVRRVLLDNVANYRKDDVQLRLLRPGLGNGLLTAEGEDWRVQRRLLAPLFTPRQYGAFSTAMGDVAAACTERLCRMGEGARINLSHEMAHVTLEILSNGHYFRKASAAIRANFRTP